MRTSPKSLLASLMACVAITTGCSLLDSGETPHEPAINIDGDLPAALLAEPLWHATSDPSAPVIVTSLGILTLHPNDERLLVPTLLGTDDGQPRWVGLGVQPGDQHALAWVEQAGQSWAVLAVTRDTKVTVYAWRGAAGGYNTSPTSTTELAGDEKAPTVTLGDAGVLLTGVTGKGPMSLWLDTGETTEAVIGKGSQAIQALNDGWLLQHKDNLGYSYFSAGSSWESKDQAPKGAKPDSGAVLASGAGYLLTTWTATDGKKPILALVRALDGVVLAAGPADPPDDVGKPLSSGATVVWGETVFNTATGEVKPIDLNGGTPEALVDQLLYITGAQEPLPVPVVAAGQGATPTVSMSPAAQVDGFTGNVTMDMETFIPGPGNPSLHVVGVSAIGQAIVRDASGENVYSVPRR